MIVINNGPGASLSCRTDGYPYCCLGMVPDHLAAVFIVSNSIVNVIAGFSKASSEAASSLPPL